MDMQRTLCLAMVIAVASIGFIAPAGALIGAGVDLNKHFGHTVNFDLDPVVQVPGVAYGLDDLNIGVTWGADYDLDALAGYPYCGMGSVGATTTGNVGYTLGLSMDETKGAGFDGSTFGLPLTEGTLSTTKYNNIIAAKQDLQSAQAALVF